ncbi:MAG: hypothetical protein ACC608_11935 [Anaerofustis sp.]
MNNQTYEFQHGMHQHGTRDTRSLQIDSKIQTMHIPYGAHCMRSANQPTTFRHERHGAASSVMRPSKGMTRTVLV